jgi:hypothetical protein
MEPRKPPSESHDRGEGSEPRTGRFKRLLSGLLSVPLADVKEAEAREREGRAKDNRNRSS